MVEPRPAGHPSRRSGWFAMVIGVGVLLIVLGVWNVIDGLTALTAGGFVVADAERVVAPGVTSRCTRNYPPERVAPSQPVPSSMDDRLAQLQQLGELRAQGVLSDAEFEQQKSRILNS